MYSFLRRPAWIVSHVLILALVAGLIGLGFWQRARWIEEQDKQERVEQTAAAPPRPLREVVPVGAGYGDVGDPLRYTRVTATGTYDTDAEVAVLNRSQGGAPGAWVLTPLLLEDGTAVAVVRGWRPYDPAGEDPPFPDSLPPTGEVTVTGNLQPTQRRGSFGGVDVAEGVLSSLFRVDLERLDQQIDADLAPMWVLLDEQDPPQTGALPRPIELSTEDPSQNFSYMMQWWIFALIGVVGYPLVLRAVARTRARGDRTPTEESDQPVDVVAAGDDR